MDGREVISDAEHVVGMSSVVYAFIDCLFDGEYSFITFILRENSKEI